MILCVVAALKGIKPSKKRKAADKDYDLEDAFIDDSDLVKQTEELEQQKLKTKHTGFFAYAGDSIELEK